MALLMAAILLRTARQDVERLVEAATQIDISQIDQIVEENLEADEEEDEEGVGSRRNGQMPRASTSAERFPPTRRHVASSHLAGGTRRCESCREALRPPFPGG
jgi:hypothetical protein